MLPRPRRNCPTRRESSRMPTSESFRWAADGELWGAESDPFLKRFSVWDTTGQQGKLLHVFFGPAVSERQSGAINPLSPDLMVAQNCEWRIDRKTGAATCLGVISRDEI